MRRSARLARGVVGKKDPPLSFTKLLSSFDGGSKSGVGASPAKRWRAGASQDIEDLARATGAEIVPSSSAPLAENAALVATAAVRAGALSDRGEGLGEATRGGAPEHTGAGAGGSEAGVTKGAETSSAASPQKRGGRKAAAAVPRVPCPTPPQWEEQVALIREMRRHGTAPVDSMGTEVFAGGADGRFHVLVAAMLSAQTRDDVVAGAMDRLRARGLTVEGVLATPEAELATLLRPVGFFNNKARYLRRTCEMLRDVHGGQMPEAPSLADLVAFPGVGPKMAHLVLNVAYNRAEGICVDVHVHRIANRIGWVRTWARGGKSQDPEKTRVALQDWLPQSEWIGINPLLVGFGQEICKPQRPACGDCLLGKNGLCPAAKRGGKL